MIKSEISNSIIPEEECIKGVDLREGVFLLIKKDHPHFNIDSYLSIQELNRYRRLYLTSLIAEEKGELDLIDQEVMLAFKNNAILKENIQDEIETSLKFGEMVADKVASFGGSWMFIITFFGFIVLWIVLNASLIVATPFDPFPFILLNLLLSCLAAVQAPLIMMSQNRQEKKDRIRGEHDYKVNLKAELEIKLLHQKVDHMIAHQNKKLLEIQELQTDFLEDLMNELKKQGLSTKNKCF